MKKLCKDRGLSTAVGDEGGFAPDLASSHDVLELIVEAVEKSGYRPGEDIVIALDAAASELYDAKSGSYYFRVKAGDLQGIRSAGRRQRWWIIMKA